MKPGNEMERAAEPLANTYPTLSRDIEEERRGEEGLVSVVIPCYNQAHFLGEAIESILSQSYQRYEIIVVDDGSTDETSEVASGYPKVRCIRQENKGLSAARNAGLDHSRGEYVVFLDADDRLLPEALEVGVKEFEAHPECAFVSGGCRRIAADGSPVSAPHRPRVKQDPYLTLLRRGNIFWMTAVAMFRRAVFSSVGGFDTSVNATADYDLYLRIARRFSIQHHGELIAEYRQHNASMSGDPAVMLEAMMAVLRAQRKHVKGNNLYEEARRAGVRKAREYYGVLLAGELRANAQQREWKQVLRGTLVLLRCYPRGLALLDERRKFALRLRNEKR